MTALEQAVLGFLAEFTDETDWCAYTRTVADGARVSEPEARLALRTLVDAGFAVRQSVFDDEGRLAGSGYAATAAGRDHLHRLEAPRRGESEGGE